MISAHDKEIQALVNDIRDGKLLLPELQRRYVWKSPQVRDLFDSLYHQYPSGQLLIWETNDLPHSRTTSLDDLTTTGRRPQLLLDGQQRLTSLAAVMLGLPLMVRDVKRPIDIAFNVNTERFEVAGPRQRGTTGWISLTKLFTQGEIAVLRELQIDFLAPEAELVLERLKRIVNIKNYKYRVNVLEDLSYDEVTHIFVRINSGGTTLNSADLTLAQLSVRWRGVTKHLEALQHQLKQKGLKADNGTLLRALSVILTGQSRLNYMFRGDRQITTLAELEHAWKRVEKGMIEAVHFLIHNCRIDRLDLLPTEYVLIPLMVFFDKFGEAVSPQQVRTLQRWFYMALIWARYSTSSETKLDQDVTMLLREGSIEGMIQNLEDQVGQRPVTERELREQRVNSPFTIMVYVLARHAHAQDWFSGVEIGGGQTLEFHHIFPKKLLRDTYDLKADSRIVDQIANLVFVSQRVNRKMASTAPDAYLPAIAEERLRAQSVPMDKDLWSQDRFEAFMLERRKLLADAINRLLQSLSDKPALWTLGDTKMLELRIDDLERTMRLLVGNRLLEAYGENGWERCVPKQIRSNIEHRHQQQVTTRPYLNGEYDTLQGKLSHCQFSDYPKIMQANWSLYEDIFGKVDNFEQYYRFATDARNAIKHHRELSRSELAAAEAGLLWLEECLHSFTVDGE